MDYFSGWGCAFSGESRRVNKFHSFQESFQKLSLDGALCGVVIVTSISLSIKATHTHPFGLNGPLSIKVTPKKIQP